MREEKILNDYVGIKILSINRNKRVNYEWIPRKGVNIIETPDMGKP